MKRIIRSALRRMGYKVSRIDHYGGPSSDDVLKNIFGKDDEILIFDVGAYTGESAIKYKKYFPNSMIYSFEPFESSFNVLSKLKLCNFNAFNLGLSDENVTQKFNINKVSATNSLLSLSDKAVDTWGGNQGLSEVESVDCHFIKLDKFCAEKSIDYIDFMKLDVQGAEFKVLQGSTSALSEGRIGVIQIEIILGDTYSGQKPLHYYIELLESFGYKIIAFSDLVHINGELVQTDLIFKRKAML